MVGAVHPAGRSGLVLSMNFERLLQNLALTVEPFATCGTAPGWRLGFPAWDMVALHFVMDGEGSLTDGAGKKQSLGPSTLVVVPPNSPHSVESGEVRQEVAASEAPSKDLEPPHLFAGPEDDPNTLKMACGRVEMTYGSHFGPFDRVDGILLLDFSGSDQMRSIFSGLLAEYGSDQPGRQTMIAALMNQCLVMVFREVSELPQIELPWVAALGDPKWAAALDAILEHPEQPHTVESLATRANMSRSVFARQFHQTFGQAPMGYVREIRLRRAARMLTDLRDLSVEAVSHRVGFESRSQFSRAFHDYFGCPPTEFRAQTA